MLLMHMAGQGGAPSSACGVVYEELQVQCPDPPHELQGDPQLQVATLP
jgi:hypothetical protein